MLLCALALTAPAQNVLFVEHEGKPCLVVGASDLNPRIEVNGKVVDVRGRRFALKSVEEYLPYFIAVRNLQVRSTYDLGDSSEINHEMHFNASFEAGYKLDDVFLLLDMQTETAGRTFFLYEVGRLLPHEPKAIRLTAPLAAPIGAGHFQFHLFVGGAEALHSEIDMSERETALDRMIAKRIAGRVDGGPKPFVGPIPEYPPSLRKAKLKGEAVISFWIRATGRTRDPVIKSASDPAFGESALAAARLWRFLPQIKNGEPVETRVDMPFVFPAPR